MQDGRPLAEALGTPVVTSGGAIPTSDTPNLSVRLTITQRCVETFKTLRIFEEVFGHVPVKNVAGRFRAADGAEQVEELCSGCGLYPARLNDLCVGCTVRGGR